MTISKIIVNISEFSNNTPPARNLSWYDFISSTYNYISSFSPFSRNIINDKQLSPDNSNHILNMAKSIIFEHISTICIPVDDNIIIDHTKYQRSLMQIKIYYTDHLKNQYFYPCCYDYNDDKHLSFIHKRSILKNAIDKAELIINHNYNNNLEIHSQITHLNIDFDRQLFA